MTTKTGSCLCETIKYTCEADPISNAVCHCKSCQKSTGTAFSTISLFPKAALNISGKTLKTYESTGDSGQPIFRHFCSNCGTTIYAEADAIPGIVFVKSGTLDDPSDWAPQIQVYWRDHQNWINDLPQQGQCFDLTPSANA